MSLPENFKERLLKELNKRGIKANCEICNQNNWSVVDQAISLNITDLSGDFRIPTPQIPSAALICNNCGNVRIFALGVLGFLQKKEGKSKDE